MNLPKTDRLYLLHILESGEEIQEYVRGMTKRAFFADHKTQDAVVRRLEIIGEATKQLSSNAREQNASVPWRRIAGMRDILIHEYFAVDLNVVWATVKNGLPALLLSVHMLLEQKT